MFQLDGLSFVCYSGISITTAPLTMTARVLLLTVMVVYMFHYSPLHPTADHLQKVVQCNERQLRPVSGTTRSRSPKEHHRRVPMDTAKRVHTAT